MRYCLVIVACCAAAWGAEVHVSPTGDDRQEGAADRPVASIARARDLLRQGKSGGIIQIHGGAYELPDGLALGAADSNVTLSAWNNQKPVLIGGRRVRQWTRESEGVYRADLAQQGFKDARFSQLIVNGRRMPMARYPNLDRSNPYWGGWAYVDGKPVNMYQDVPGEDRRTLRPKASDARSWKTPQDGEVFVFPRYNWWNNIVRIESIDGSGAIHLKEDASYAIRPGDRYFVQGPREELDAPGEWFLDRRAQALYFLPEGPIEAVEACAPTTRAILKIDGATGVRVRGLTFECAEGTAVEINRSDDCRVEACTVKNVGDYRGCGVAINGGARNSVAGCDISHTGSHGVSVSGGDRIKLIAAGHAVDNNYIHHVGAFYKQGVGISMTGCGIRAAHNLIHDGPRMGIMFAGNNLLIEFNEIRHTNLETEDTGAVYTGGRDWIGSRGTVIRHNYFHDMLGFGRDSRTGNWVSPHFAWGVYLDDNAGGVDVVGNIIARCPRAGIHLHNGRDNLMENNLIVDCGLQQVEYGGWTRDHPYWKDHSRTMIATYDKIIQEPAWQSMRNIQTHPRDAVLPDGKIMSGNVFRRNVLAWGGDKSRLYRMSNVPFDHNVWENNLIWHDGLPIVAAKLTREAKSEDLASWQAGGLDKGSIVADPQIADRARSDYRLASTSPAFKLGFQPIPIDQIGPRNDGPRASWPIVEAEGAREALLRGANPK